MFKFKVGYFGDGPWAHKALKRLLTLQHVEIMFVCARFSFRDPILREMAQAKNIPFLFEKDINSEVFIDLLRGFDCDLFISMSFNQIFKHKILSIAPYGAINCHAGKLPFYRGRNPLNWALINDEKSFGITVHYIDLGIDTGDIILQEDYNICDNDSYGTLLETAYRGCADLICRAVDQICRGTVNPRSQAEMHPVGTYGVKRGPGEEKIDWAWGSRRIFNFIRAISKPGPQAVTVLHGGDMFINRAEMINKAPVFIGIPGSVLMVGTEGVTVKTGDSSVLVTEYLSTIHPKIGDRLQ